MSHLTKMQRYKIQALLEQKSTIKTIAEYLGKDKSVISREIKRNRDQRSKKYDAELAQRKYKKRLHEKPKHIRLTSSMKRVIDNLLLQDYSPEQIKGRMSILGKIWSVMSGYISISGRTRSKEENYTSTYAEM